MTTAYATDNITHGLFEWDRRQAKRDRSHNSRFLPLALQAVDDAKEDYPQATVRELVLRALNGRCRDFVLRSMGQDIATEAELRQYGR